MMQHCLACNYFVKSVLQEQERDRWGQWQVEEHPDLLLSHPSPQVTQPSCPQAVDSFEFGRETSKEDSFSYINYV